MSVKSKVRTDLILGWPMATVLNWVTRLLGFFLRIDHSFSKTPKRIIVCKFLGMGSIIQATPLLQTLRKNFPEANITFVSTLPNRSILSLFPFIDNIVCVNDVGHVFNARGAEGQQYGGAYMALGRNKSEEKICCPRTGVGLNYDHIGYQLGTMNDYPVIQCLLNESHLGYSAYGACGIGENIGAAMSSILCGAVYNAIG